MTFAISDVQGSLGYCVKRDWWTLHESNDAVARCKLTFDWEPSAFFSWNYRPRTRGSALWHELNQIIGAPRWFYKSSRMSSKDSFSMHLATPAQLGYPSGFFHNELIGGSWVSIECPHKSCLIVTYEHKIRIYAKLVNISPLSWRSRHPWACCIRSNTRATKLAGFLSNA